MTLHMTTIWKRCATCHRSSPMPHLKLPALQVIALQASENPAMMAVVSQLQHAVLTMPWEVRIAAAQAIAKVRRHTLVVSWSSWQLLLANIRCRECSNHTILPVPAQVAVRSEEPYRIHCYSILRSLAASDHAAGNDALGQHPYPSPARAQST
jgi:hypothetical protein